MRQTADVGSIQARLLRTLMVSLLALLILSGFVTWFVAYRVANDAYDHALLDPVMDLVQNVRQGPNGPTLTLTAREQEALLFDGSDRVFFQVRDARGRWFAGGQRDLPPPPEPLVARVPTFYSATVGDSAVRIAAMRTDPGFEIYVAETTNKRDRLVWEVILTGLLPSLILIIAAVALVWFGVSHGLAPLRKLRNELAQRSPDDLRALDLSHAPSEVRPAIAALNRLFQRIRETRESQRRFLANAAHQLRTPLAGMQMQLELALREPTSESLRVTLGKMRDAVLRSGRVTNRLLALARAEQAVPDGEHFKSIDLHALAERVGAQWIQPAIARNIDFGFDLAPAIVEGDDALLAEMLDNMIDNALRYTPAGGAVTVRCGADENGPYLGVEDTGIGIPESEREKVFERFYRGAGAGGDGSGLGLAIVKEGADRHAASVVVAPSAAGIGTFIQVRFREKPVPVHAAPSAPPPQRLDVAEPVSAVKGA
ncbi:MAG TPA: sensor histidine kinase [Casimicrobiaceae bacterium]|nr:sensor histidine kinase [Casimicrobiaceae bacterium]